MADTQTISYDGVTHEFPASFTQADIAKALKTFDNSPDNPKIKAQAIKNQSLGESGQGTGPEEYLKGLGGTLGNAAVEGLKLGIPGLSNIGGDLTQSHIDVVKKGLDALKKGRTTEGLGYLGAGAIPGIGPAAAALIDKATGEPTMPPGQNIATPSQPNPAGAAGDLTGQGLIAALLGAAGSSTAGPAGAAVADATTTGLKISDILHPKTALARVLLDKLMSKPKETATAPTLLQNNTNNTGSLGPVSPQVPLPLPAGGGVIGGGATNALPAQPPPLPTPPVPGTNGPGLSGPVTPSTTPIPSILQQLLMKPQAQAPEIPAPGLGMNLSTNSIGKQGKVRGPVPEVATPTKPTLPVDPNQTLLDEMAKGATADKNGRGGVTFDKLSGADQAVIRKLAQNVIERNAVMKPGTEAPSVVLQTPIKPPPESALPNNYRDVNAKMRAAAQAGELPPVSNESALPKDYQKMNLDMKLKANPELADKLQKLKDLLGIEEK